MVSRLPSLRRWAFAPGSETPPMVTLGLRWFPRFPARYRRDHRYYALVDSTPIKPVVLSEKEKVIVEQKLQRASSPADKNSGPGSRRDTVPQVELDRPYSAGSHELRLTKRELNGLLNANADLGKTVRIELGRDAINAYLAVPIPRDFSRKIRDSSRRLLQMLSGHHVGFFQSECERFKRHRFVVI